MTAEEIRNSKNESDDGAWECAKWVRELAAQLAEANAARQAREEKVDQDIAEAKARAEKKSEFFDELVAELKPMLPKIREFIDKAFAPSDPWPGDSGFVSASGLPFAGMPVAVAPGDECGNRYDAPL